jgi:hypothetical protein
MTARSALLAALLIGAYFVALYWLADASDPRCKRAVPSDGPALEIERMFPKDCHAGAGGAK